MASPYELGGTQLWPAMVFNRIREDHEREAPALIEHLYAVQAASKERIASGVALAAKSMDGLFESDFDLFESDAAPIRSLRAWIEDSVRQAASVANGRQVPPERLKVEFTEAWCHITNSGGFHDAHYHGNCSWCGIFYVDAADCRPTDATGAGNGISRFYAPLGTGGLIQDYGSQYLANNRVDILPTNGLLILFPSFLLHSGLPYRGDSDRILIAFNTKTFVG
jgi:uncharacterized protein (TIGR02466 family)